MLSLHVEAILQHLQLIRNWVAEARITNKMKTKYKSNIIQINHLLIYMLSLSDLIKFDGFGTIYMLNNLPNYISNFITTLNSEITYPTASLTYLDSYLKIGISNFNMSCSKQLGLYLRVCPELSSHLLFPIVPPS